MRQTNEQLDKLFIDLAARLRKYQPGESVSFHWVFDSNEELAAFEEDVRFKELFADCERKKTVQPHTMKSATNSANTSPTGTAIRWAPRNSNTRLRRSAHCTAETAGCSAGK